MSTYSPYQSNINVKNVLQTPPRQGDSSQPGTEKKQYNDFGSHEDTKNALHQTAVAHNILSQENGNLKQDIEFWQGKVGHAEQEKAAQLQQKDDKHRAAIAALKNTHDNQNALHQTEIDRLKGHVEDKQAQIGGLAANLKDKHDEAERLKCDNGAKDAEIFNKNRENADLKQISDFQAGENEKLRNDKAGLTGQLFQSQQNEAGLKDNEQKLYGQIAALRDTLGKQDQDNREAHAIKDHNHDQQTQGLQLAHANEKEALNNAIAGHVQNGNLKDAQNAALQNKLNQALGDLANSQRNHQNAVAEGAMWRDKHGQSEADKANQLDQARKLREATVDQMNRNHSIEKGGLENRLSALNNALVNKEGELNNTRNAWNDTENKKKNLELAKATLEVQLRDWMKKKQDADQSYQNQLRVQNDVHSNNLAQQQAQAQRDKELLANQIAGLRGVVDTKHKELNDARTNAHLNAIRAQENDKKYRDASNEAELWKVNADKINREKSAEIDAAHNLRSSQLAAMNKQHGDDIARQEAEKQALRGVIGQKHQEAEQFKNLSGQLGSDLKAKEVEANKHACDSQAWKSKAEQEANLRNHLTNEAESHKSQLRGIIVDKEKEANDLKQSQIRLQGDLYNTQQHAQRQENEAKAWQNQASNEQRQRSVDRGIQEDLHRQTTLKMRESHEAEKDHLHSHINDLHGHVQKKQQEAADWRRSYHANRYGNK